MTPYVVTEWEEISSHLLYDFLLQLLRQYHVSALAYHPRKNCYELVLPFIYVLSAPRTYKHQGRGKSSSGGVHAFNS